LAEQGCVDPGAQDNDDDEAKAQHKHHVQTTFQHAVKKVINVSTLANRPDKFEPTRPLDVQGRLLKPKGRMIGRHYFEPAVSKGL